MTSYFNWLDRPGAEPEPEQYHAIIAALGDWIEALLEARAAMSAEGVDVAAAARIAEEKGKVAKARAIEAGYVWRLDLDP